MEFKQMRYFSEIVREGSVTRAASTLGIAQSALSLCVRNLERDLGVQLLHRSAQGVQPTDAGLRLARHARLMLDEQRRLEDELRNLEGDPRGEVRIGLPGTIGEIITLPLIETARTRFPGVKVTISESMSGFVEHWLLEHKIDLAILYTEPRDPTMMATPLVREELVVFAVPETFPDGPVAMASLRDVELVLPSRMHGLRIMIDQQMRALGSALDPILELDSYRAIKQVVLNGGTASILPFHAVADECADQRFEARRLSDPPMWRTANLVSQRISAMSFPTVKIHGLLGEVASTLIAQGRWRGAELLPTGAVPVA